MFLLLVPWVHAAPFFLSIGSETPIDVDRSGNWPRALHTEEGWDFFYASGGDYWYTPLDDTLRPDLTRTKALTGRSDLVDHAITRCPDGSLLHAASYTVNTPDDSVATFWYDGGDLGLEEQATIVDGGGQIVTRDMPVVCGDRFQGIGLFDMAAGTAFAEVSPGEAEGSVVLDDAPMMTGSGWAEHDGSLWTIGHDISEWGATRLRGYDADFDLHTSVDLSLVPAPLEAYWSQGLLQLGDYAVVVFMARDDTLGWQLQDGDVWLAVLDADWQVVETLQVTTNAPPVGAMQPGLALKGDRLLVTYVRDLALYAVEVQIDAGLARAPTQEEPLPAEVGGTGGCSGGAGAGLFLLPLLLGGGRRATRPRLQ